MTQFICVLGAPQTGRTSLAAELFATQKRVCSPCWLSLEPPVPYTPSVINGVSLGWMIEQIQEYVGNFEFVFCDWHPLQPYRYSFLEEKCFRTEWLFRKYDILTVATPSNTGSGVLLKKHHAQLMQLAKERDIKVYSDSEIREYFQRVVV